MNGLKLLGRLGTVLLIFFSLQGEVILRYADLFTGKIEKHFSIPKNLAERQKLIKLQCFTKNSQPVIVPEPLCHTDRSIGFELKSRSFLHDDAAKPFRESRCSPLRGPPTEALVISG